MRKFFMITIMLIMMTNIYSEKVPTNVKLEELDAQFQKLQEAQEGSTTEIKKNEDKETQVYKDSEEEKQGTDANGEVIYYYLPPEIKVTNEERARVIGKVRNKMKQKELEEKIATGKVTAEEIKEEEEAKAKVKAEETQAKAEEEKQKKLEKFKKDQKIKEIEKTLGVTEKEKKEWEEFNKMSEEMQEIMKKQKELDEKYFKGNKK